MRVEFFLKPSYSVRKADLSLLTAMMNRLAESHNPPFGSLCAGYPDEKTVDGSLALIFVALQVQPASATSYVVGSIIAILIDWLRQIDMNLSLELLLPEETRFTLTTELSEVNVFEISKLVNLSLQTRVEQAKQEEPISLPDSPTLEQIRQFVNRITRKKITGLVKKKAWKDGLAYIFKADGHDFVCTRDSSLGEWSITQLSSDENPNRIWTTLIQYPYLNICLSLDAILPVDPPGLAAEFSHAIIELDTGVERKYFRSCLGLLIVHTRLIQVDAEQATEFVLEVPNPKRYLHRINKRYGIVDYSTSGFAELSELPF